MEQYEASIAKFTNDGAPMEAGQTEISLETGRLLLIPVGDPNVIANLTLAGRRAREAEIDARIEECAAMEAEIVAEMPLGPRMH